MKDFINWRNINKIVFDFDGIFTNNKVFLNHKGEEFICCDRSDGLGFDILKYFAKKNKWKLLLMVLTKERNEAALARCKKLDINCENAIDDKAKFLKDKFKNSFNKDSGKLDGLIYLGNDFNDLEAIKLAQFSVCPKDAHPIIKQNTSFVLDSNGGEGFIRSFIEKLININLMNNEEIFELLK